MLSWVHFGDLHASNEDNWESLRLPILTGEVGKHLAWATDFVFLPAANAHHGEPEQYRRIRDMLDHFSLRWLAIPCGDDFESQSLANFYERRVGPKLPFSVTIKGHRCLFLDIISAGRGGPDFRLGAAQTDRLKDQLEQSRSDQEHPVAFMLAFPGDLADNVEGVAGLFAEHGVVSVDTGHTHYNEVLNDGGAIYTAARSTGQTEEGPPGFSIHAVDGSVASWRFKRLESSWPFVLMTSAADYRLIVDPTQEDQSPSAAFTVCAKVFGADVDDVTPTLGEQDGVTMTSIKDSMSLWTAGMNGLATGRHKLMVTAVSSAGETDSDTIGIDVSEAGQAVARALKPNPGDHVHSIGAWPEWGLLGTQLGPDKNGTIKW